MRPECYRLRSTDFAGTFHVTEDFLHRQFPTQARQGEGCVQGAPGARAQCPSEDACLLYTVTRQIDSPFAQGESFPIVFHEIWANREAFEAHCQRSEIQQFFQSQVESPDGDVEAANVCVYTDEPIDFDAPQL
ncbi:hypothetical protein Q427_32930 [Halomonas sp. BC04]|nr:hypothetical protein Q427_32930 [Halomonas sp. BC04]